MSIITRSDFINGLLVLPGAVMATIHCCTVPAMRKTGNPFVGRTKKFVGVNGTLNSIYENRVNNRRSKNDLEPTFTAQPRAWGIRRVVNNRNTPLVDYKDKQYVELTTNVNPPHTLYTYYTVDDQLPTEEDFSNLLTFLDDPSDNKRQGLAFEKQVPVRDYRVENILAIKWGGTLYTIAENLAYRYPGQQL